MNPDDRDADLLRQALRRSAETVEIRGDGLERIRARTRRPRLVWWQRPAALAAAAAVLVVAGGVGGALVLDRPPAPRGDSVATGGDAGPTVAEAPTGEPSTSPTLLPTPLPTRSAAPTSTPPTVAAPPAQGGASAVPVYYAGDTARGPLLFREFHRVGDSGDRVRKALEEMFAGAATDPDYFSLWPEGIEVRSVKRSGDLATLDLSADVRGGPLGSEAGTTGWQQLVYTVTAADPQIKRVRVLAEGSAREMPGVLSRAPQSETLAPVWIIDPADGARVGRTFTMSGDASVVEATVYWEVTSGVRDVRKGYATATVGGPGRGTWSVRLTLPAGTYTLRAYEVSGEDGAETSSDTKTVTVR